MSIIRKVIEQKFYPPKPATETCTGKIVLITGASGGLGLEAAKKLAALNASTLIITARNDTKGEATKKQIEVFLQSTASNTRAKTSSPTEIIPVNLDMSSAAGVQSFVTALKSKVTHLDAAILNAGTIQTTYIQSPDGWEETIQVNALSTLLVGSLLIPLLLASPRTSAPTAKDRPHLTFVSSGYAWLNTLSKMSAFLPSPSPLTLLSSRNSFPPGTLGGQAQYGRSKLILEYGMRHLASLPSVNSQIIVSSTCPGMCKSDLGRQYNSNWLLRIATWIVMTFIARSAEQGANSYVTCLGLGEEGQGQMWKDDRVFGVGEMVGTEEGKGFGQRVWKELREWLGGRDQGVKEMLEAEG